MLLCGAPVIAQEGMGQPGSPASSNNSTGSMTSTGEQGRSATGMQENSSTSVSSAQASAADKSFMKEAMMGDMAEIQLAQLAQQKASSDQVKQFAQRMIDDHTKLEAQMKPLAQQFGVDAPSDLDSKHKSLQSRLQGLSGDKFDQEYMKAMVADHREDDQKFLREENSAKSPELKNAVTQAEPIIAEHLRMAQDIDKSLKGKGSNSGSTSSQ
jgi:putative membrane protein